MWGVPYDLVEAERDEDQAQVVQTNVDGLQSGHSQHAASGYKGTKICSVDHMPLHHISNSEWRESVVFMAASECNHMVLRGKSCMRTHARHCLPTNSLDGIDLEAGTNHE